MNLYVSSKNLTIGEILAIVQENSPNRTAIIDSIQSMSYSLLVEQANQLSNWLQEQDLNGGDIVGIILEPSIEFVICALAVVQFGAIYLPIDPQTPVARIETIIDNARPKIIIIEEFFKLSEKANYKTWRLSSILQKINKLSITFKSAKQNIDDACCIYYTSGSTGMPKGVLISQKAIINLAKISNPFDNNIEMVAQFNNLNFDPTILEIWATLLNGVCLYIIPNPAKQNPQLLRDCLMKYNVRMIVVPTAYLHQIINSNPETFDNIELLHFGGEQVNPILLKMFIEYRISMHLPIKLINNYGPTEATAVSCRKLIEMSMKDNKIELSSIGNPIENVKIYLLDKNLRPVSKADIGELYIAGLNLSLGYYKSSKLNNEKFLNNPFSDDVNYNKLYKTGDLAEQLPNGELRYVGRTDDQIKIHGFRVHLSEIESQILQFDNVASAVVVYEFSKTGRKFLKAYIVLHALSSKLYAEKLRSFLEKRLPSYMMPAKFIQVEQLPLNNIGKINKKQLKYIPQIDLDIEIDNFKECTIIEKLQLIWQDILHRENLDADRNLFEMGVTSILIAEACFKINQALSISLKIADIIANPSINKLANYLNNMNDNKTNNDKIIFDAPLEIAVVGFSCRFPQAENWTTYWHNICNGRECISDFGQDVANNLTIKFNGQKFIPAKGVINSISGFDASFFGFSPVDAKALDPQQRIMLECAWEALEMSGNTPQANKKVSVFAGMADSSYLQENLLKNTSFQMQNDWFNTRVFTSMGALSTRISYCFDLKGKSLNINTACSTGLVAIEQACRDLTDGSSDIALAGGVSIDVHHRNGYFYQENGIESADGRCRPFDSNASGTVFSDGAGIVVLKRLDDAIKDNDTIYAIIRGCGINNDGADKLSFTAPSINGQINCIKAAINQAQISANQVGFIEAHGTATMLGDIIEFEALKKAHRSYTAENSYCALGSVKANIGHTDIAAGVAGFIKAALCLYYKKIPPMLHFKHANPKLDVENSPFYINKTCLEWESSKPRYAGVSAFGIGGTNAHIILEEYTPKINNNQLSTTDSLPFVLSAKTVKGLDKSTVQMINYLNSLNETNIEELTNIAYTLQIGRSSLPYRRIAVGKNISELVQNLSTSKIIESSNKTNKLVFMFSGQGAQYSKMCIELLDKDPYFANIVTYCNDLIKSYLECDLLELIRNDSSGLINETQYTQPALFMFEYALTKLLSRYGIVPNAMIGHSIGEYVAACVAGVFSLEDAIKLVCKRGLLMAEAPPGGMLAIQCDYKDLLVISEDMNVEVAVHNSVNSYVVSGTPSEIEKLKQKLDMDKKFEYQALNVLHPFHSSLLDETSKRFKEAFIDIQLHKPNIPIVSNLTGTWLVEEFITPEYWCNHLRYAVQFKNGVDILLQDGYRYFIEIGVGHSLSAFVKEISQSQKLNIFVCHTLPNIKKYTTDVYQLSNTLGLLWQAGFKIDWNTYYHNVKKRRISLPTYPFQRHKYWIEPDSNPFQTNSRDLENWFYQPIWSHKASYKRINTVEANAAQYEWVIFNDGSGCGDLVIATLKKNNIEPIIIEIGNSFQVINNEHYVIVLNEKEHYKKIFSNLGHNNKQLMILHMFSYNESDSPSILTKKEIDEGLDKSFYSMLFLAQSFIEIFGSEAKMKCGIITTGSQQVVGNEILNPVNASLTGICRVIPQEHQNLQLKLIDVALTELKEPSLPIALINFCANDWNKPHPIVAFRNGFVWDISHSRVKLSKNVNRFKDKGVYLCTGGLGGIALTLCEAIARKVKNPIFILISRTKLPKEGTWELILEDPGQIKLHQSIKVLQLLLSLGAELHIEQADVADYNQLESVLHKITNLYGGLNGVIHAAGVPGGGVAQLKKKENASAVFTPKLYGTYNLANVVKGYHLDFVMLCSSISALVGEAGQTDYCGANACLDTFAVSNLFNSDFTVSIDWNTWESVGMAVNTERPDDVMSSDMGNSITPSQGQYAFMKIMQNDYCQTAISSFELDGYTNLVNKRQRIQEIEHERANDTNYIPPSNDIEEQMVQLWQTILGIDKIGIGDDFFSLGGHSLKALKLIEKANKILKNRVTLEDLFRARTISNLISLAPKETNYESTSSLKTIPNAKSQIFMFHPVVGNVLCYKHIVDNLNIPFSIVGISDPGMYENGLKFPSLNSMVENYIQQIRQIQPSGPYYFIGYSFGGTVAYEVAHILKQQNQKIGMLCMIDSYAIFAKAQNDEHKFKQILRQYNPELSDLVIDLTWDRMRLLMKHKLSKTNQNILLFKASQIIKEWGDVNDKYNGWGRYTSGVIDLHILNDNHETIIYKESSIKIAKILQDELITR